MIKATDGEPPREFSVPDGIRFERVNPVSGAAASLWTRDPMQVALRSGQTPPVVFENSAGGADQAAEVFKPPAGIREQSDRSPPRSNSMIIEEDLLPDRR
jgi:hypothetical protein